jgi:hypothetical protein
MKYSYFLLLMIAVISLSFSQTDSAGRLNDSLKMNHGNSQRIALDNNKQNYMEIVLVNGHEVKGYEVSEDDQRIVLDLNGQREYCYRSAIASLKINGNPVEAAAYKQPVSASHSDSSSSRGVLSIKKARIYVNFISAGLNIANMSEEYTNLLGNYWGNVLYNMLDSQYTVSPENSTCFTWNFGAEFGYYPVKYWGINLGCYFMGEGDESKLLTIGSESVCAEEHVVSMKLPVFMRLRGIDDKLCPFVDAGMAFSYVLSAKEKLAYNNGDNSSSNENWYNINLFDETNRDNYHRAGWALVLGAGLHFCYFMNIEYRLYCGMTNFAKNVDSKFITHALTFGFDYYY